MENSSTCESCNVNVHRASYVKYLRNKKPLEKIKPNDLIIPDCLIKEEQTPFKNKIKKLYNPKPLKQIARENIRMNDNKLEEDLAKKKVNPFF